MQDFSSVNIKNMIIHNVGNKVKGESLDLSTEICDTNNKVTNQYLKQFFFSTFKFDITYRFVHETDIAMNEIYNYVKHIFDNSDQFYEQSVNIAKHLYEVSVHPNIKAGELCIVYLQNCIIDDNVTDAVGIYKSESKDYYLQVNSTENGYDIECQQGINPKKLDKGCLIFNSSDSNYKVCVVDKNVNDQELRLDIEREAAYYVNIDYFYGLFFERCDIYIDFIMQKIMLFNLEYEKTKSSISLIHDLRTYKSHTLDKMKLHDKDLIDRVEKWHFRLTGSKKISDENYLICSNQLINLAEEILDAMLSCIRRIETDERKEHMIREMLMAKDNYCPDFYIESQFNAVMTAVHLL